MQKEMNMLIPTNTTPTEDFIAAIKYELSCATTAWMRIAASFSEAESQFGYTSNAFKAVLKATDFTLSTATKLVKIARSDRLKKHADQIGKVQAWTVLYAIATLTDEQFERLLINLDDGQIVTSGLVAKAKNQPKQSDPYQSVYNIRIDINALRGDLVDGKDFEALHDLIAKIQNTIPYIRVDATKRTENAASWHCSGIQREYERLLKKRFMAAIASYKAYSPEWKYYVANKAIRSKPYIANFVNVDDALEALRENPAEAFAALGSDGFNQAQIYNEAANEFAKKTDALAEKANSAFLYANSIENSEIDLDTLKLSTNPKISPEVLATMILE